MLIGIIWELQFQDQEIEVQQQNDYFPILHQQREKSWTHAQTTD